MNTFTIGTRTVGPGNPTFVIAEAGVNHNGDLASAIRLIDTAAEAGADAVKFQTFSANAVASVAAPKAEYQLRTTGAAESQADMLRRLELDTDAHETLQAHAAELGIVFLSTPFDNDSVDLLDRLHVPAIKVGSGELTNLPLLRYIASKGRPTIVSTGMSYLAEVEQAVEAIAKAGNPPLALLHCVSNYPTDAADANLRAMKTMARRFAIPIGYSDHTLGIEVALAAVALGACIIEKHLTLDRTMPGPDHEASLEPAELALLVRSVRNVEAALGSGEKVPAASEANTREIARRSIATAVPIARGSVLTPQALRLLRPATGLPPSDLDRVIGRKAAHDLDAGQLLDWSDLA